MGAGARGLYLWPCAAAYVGASRGLGARLVLTICAFTCQKAVAADTLTQIVARGRAAPFPAWRALENQISGPFGEVCSSRRAGAELCSCCAGSCPGAFQGQPAGAAAATPRRPSKTKGLGRGEGSGWGPQSTRPPFLLEYMAFKVGRSESSIFYIRAHESFYHKEIQ